MVFEFRQWGIFPPELYLLLLECLNCIDETAQGSVAILGVSLLSHSHYELVTSWVSRVAEEEILTIKELESKGNMPPTRNERPRTCLAIFCKKLSGICAVCNCRKETHELFTGIQLCQTCDALFFPKISLTRFNELFRATVLGQEKARDRKFRYRTQRTAGSDVAGLERQEPGPIFRQGVSAGNSEIYNAEDYGHYFPPNSKANYEDYWPKSLVWAKACKRWDDQLLVSDRDALRPSVRDMILLRKFSYRFERNWTPKRHLQYELREYFQIARHWATSAAEWQSRPWGVGNFPFQPRSSVTDSILGTIGQGGGRFDIYQSRCAEIRKILKIFPKILLSPTLWRECITGNKDWGNQDVILRMEQAFDLSQRGPPEDLEFILRGNPGDADVKLVRMGEVQMIELRVALEKGCNLDLVRLKGGLIESINEDVAIFA